MDKSGKKILILPVEPLRPKAGTNIETVGHVPGLPGKIGEVPVATRPFERTDKEGKTLVYADLREVAGWLGAGLNDTADGKFEATTAPAWETLLGLTPHADAAPTDLVGDFGVSPPAASFVLWARARRPAWVQMYSLNEDKGPEPMFGVDPLTGKSTTGTQGGLIPRARAIAGGESARVPTMFGRRNPGVASYAALFLRNDPGADDPLEAIAQGRVKPEDYVVVGLRQRIGDTPLTFKDVVTKPNQSLAMLAEDAHVDLDLLRALNGLVPDEGVPSGTSLVVPERANYVEKPLPDSIVVGDDYAKGGETITSLAQAWGVPLGDAMDANPGFEPDEPLAVGEILKKLRPRATKPATPGGTAPNPPLPPAPKKPPIGTANVKRSVAMRLAPGAPFAGEPLPKSALLDVIDRSGTYLRVVYRGRVGFVDRSNLSNIDLDDDASSTPATPAAGGDRPAIDPNASPIVKDALRYYGTPYDWGGASLTKGIDCSHFVSAIYHEVGLKCPPPPVTSQEGGGDIEHWKSPGLVARRAGATQAMPSSTPSFARLRPGDRFIIQRGLNDATGSRHTGIYAGRLLFRGRQYTNAVIHASCSRGITVDELTASWMWKDYKYSVSPVGAGGRR